MTLIASTCTHTGVVQAHLGAPARPGRPVPSPRGWHHLRLRDHQLLGG